jgi:hypothetical protein
MTIKMETMIILDKETYGVGAKNMNKKTRQHRI